MLLQFQSSLIFSIFILVFYVFNFHSKHNINVLLWPLVIAAFCTDDHNLLLIRYNMNICVCLSIYIYICIYISICICFTKKMRFKHVSSIFCLFIFIDFFLHIQESFKRIFILNRTILLYFVKLFRECFVKLNKNDELKFIRSKNEMIVLRRNAITQK